MVKAWLTVPAALVPDSVKAKVPGCAGTPLIQPVVASSARPGGKAPLVTTCVRPIPWIPGNHWVVTD